MIKLSKRLETIANFIDNKDRVLDVGCDHALLDIYIVKKNKGCFCIASDLTPKSLEPAKINIEKYGLSNFIDVRYGDGLNVLNLSDKVNTVVISGMGYQKIIKILKDGKNNLKNIEKLIIQSNTFPKKIRKYLISIGYYIYEEKLVKENNIIYTIIIFKPGNKKYNKTELELGPILLKIRDHLFNELLDVEIKKNTILLNVIPRKYFIKRFKLYMELKMLLNEKSS